MPGGSTGEILVRTSLDEELALLGSPRGPLRARGPARWDAPAEAPRAFCAPAAWGAPAGGFEGVRTARCGTAPTRLKPRDWPRDRPHGLTGRVSAPSV